MWFQQLYPIYMILLTNGSKQVTKIITFFFLIRMNPERKTGQASTPNSTNSPSKGSHNNIYNILYSWTYIKKQYVPNGCAPHQRAFWGQVFFILPQPNPSPETQRVILFLKPRSFSYENAIQTWNQSTPLEVNRVLDMGESILGVEKFCPHLSHAIQPFRIDCSKVTGRSQ
jgi:hypothetical protein